MWWYIPYGGSRKHLFWERIMRSYEPSQKHAFLVTTGCSWQLQSDPLCAFISFLKFFLCCKRASNSPRVFSGLIFYIIFFCLKSQPSNFLLKVLLMLRIFYSGRRKDNHTGPREFLRKGISWSCRGEYDDADHVEVQGSICSGKG